MNEIVLKRIVIYPKDIERMTGKKERAARNYLYEIKPKSAREKPILFP